MAERPPDPDLDRDFARANGWDRAYETYDDFDLPTYVGPVTFMKLPWITDPAELRRRGWTWRSSVRRSTTPSATDPAPASARARSARRSTRRARSLAPARRRAVRGARPLSMRATRTSFRLASIAAHALIYRKVLEVAESGAIPIILGGDHSITWPTASAVAEARSPGTIGIVHFDAHADTAADDWGVFNGHGTPMRRLIESGAVKGSNFVQVGLRGYWPPAMFQWMREQGLRYHFMREIEERGAEAVVAQAIDEALDGPDTST